MALLGDEAAALGALHAGLSAAYGYPGTPSTEILEYLIAEYEKGGPRAAWCSNEKTALEAALGVSFTGRRALIAMKHVGLNVAADPFINSALLGIRGGLVLAVADDPGMHSSQNEQDSRFYAAFAITPCIEPRSQQEAYDMAREAFDVSERFRTPVLLRLVTRLSHARAGVSVREARGQNSLSQRDDRTKWLLLPAFARQNYLSLIEKRRDMEKWAWDRAPGALEMEGRDASFVVITAGLGGNYYEENLEDFTASRGGKEPARFHVSAYPLPEEALRRLCADAERALVIEEGQPFIEEKLRGILPQRVRVSGKLDGTLERTGELDPDITRRALGLPPRPSIFSVPAGEGSSAFEAHNGGVDLPQAFGDLKLPPRPPQLCAGCPHCDSYGAIMKAVEELDPAEGHPSVAVLSDIGCYSLGAMPPYSVPESIVCMGASVGMARGAAEAGVKYAIGVIGDSTFLHSGTAALIDAATAGTPMTLVILDNSAVAMTGCQETILPSSRLRELLLGIGIAAERILELEARKQLIEYNAGLLKKEVEHPGVSVVIFRRECLEAARKRKKAEI
jgi:indolepyruvate ferredoxin oxidoreductase alpha subunit